MDYIKALEKLRKSKVEAIANSCNIKVGRLELNCAIEALDLKIKIIEILLTHRYRDDECIEKIIHILGISSKPSGNERLSVYDGCSIVNFETCNHRKETDVFGVKKKSLFCDIDNIECDECNGSCRNINSR